MQLFIAAIYLLVLVGISLLSRRWTSDQEGYFLASRSLGPVQLTSTLAATSIGGSAVILVIGQVYQNGLPFIWTDIAGGLGLILLGWLLAGKVRSTGCYSLPEIAGVQYGQGARQLSSALVVVAELGFLALLLRACAGLLSPLFGLSADLSVVVICAFFILYTLIGGQRAVAQTDVLQLGLTMTAVLLLLILAVISPADWAAMPDEHLSFPFNEHFPPVNILSLILITGLPHLVGSDLFGKVLCARDAETARRGAVNAGFLKIAVGFLVGLTGAYAAILLPSGLNPDTVITELLLRHAGQLLSALVIIGLVATLMSSADSVMLTAATILTRDILQSGDEKSAFTGKAMTVVVGAVGIALTLLFPTMLSAFLFAYTLFSGAIVIPVLLGFWRQQLGLTRRAALAAMSTGGIIIILLTLLEVTNEIITMAGILGNAAVLFLFSWIERALTKDPQ